MNQPNSIESEEAVLACCVIQPDIFDDVCQFLSASDFYWNQNQLVFSSIAELAMEGAQIDEIAILEKLRSNGEEEASGGFDTLTRIQDRVETAMQWKRYAEVVQEKSKLRKLLRTLRGAIEQVQSNDESQTVCSKIENSLIELNKEEHEDDTIAESVVLVQDDLKAQLNGTYSSDGLKTGVESIDELMKDGLENGTLTIVAAPTSCGKSQFALNVIGLHSITGDLPSGYFSYEMPSKQLSKRMLRTFSGVNLGKFRDMTASAKEQQRVAQTVKKMQDSMILTNCTNRSVESLCSLARQWKRKHGIGTLVVDYLQLMSAPRGMEGVKAIEHNTQRLKGLALDLNIPIQLLVQVNREACKHLENNPGRGLRLHDLKGGSSIEQDADNAILFWPSKGEAGDSRTVDQQGRSIMNLKCCIAKQREGARDVRCDLLFMEDTGRFRSIPHMAH